MPQYKISKKKSLNKEENFISISHSFSPTSNHFLAIGLSSLDILCKDKKSHLKVYCIEINAENVIIQKVKIYHLQPS